jgi:glycerol uptake facilitator-like aquaporin
MHLSGLHSRSAAKHEPELLLNSKQNFSLFEIHNCGHGLLIRALETVIPTLCPACGPADAIAKKVSKTEAIPSNIVQVAGAICCGILLLFTGAKIVDDLFSS